MIVELTETESNNIGVEGELKLQSDIDIEGILSSKHAILSTQKTFCR